MQFFEALDDKKAKCLLCSHYCQIKPNAVGICGVNKNINGEIKCLVYGHISAFNIDPIEKKPLYHFLPNSKSLSLGTVGCNFSCTFCQNHGISQEKNIDTSRFISAKEVVQIALKNSCKSISYTYNEPSIFYPFAKDIAKEAKKYGIKSVYVSNGFESYEVIEDMKGLIDAINVDLKSFDEKYYKTKLGGDLKQVLKNLIHLKNNDIWIEITTLIIPSVNDSSEELIKIVKWIKENLGVNTPWHISAFHPDYKEQNLPRTPIKTLEKAKKIAQDFGLNYVYIGNTGFTNSTYCPKCKEELIKRKYFSVQEQNLNRSFCPNCNSKIHGVFEKKSEEKNKDKEKFMENKIESFKGSFYPETKEEILKFIKHFNSNFSLKNTLDIKPRAIISPHAGYIYSGFTANLAYNIASNNISKPKRVIVIGPSHKVFFHGASLALYENYQTPLGNIKIDLEYSLALKEKFDFIDFKEEAHKEHSTETQAPFIKHYFNESKIIEIVYGKIIYEELSRLLDEVLKDEDNFIIISSDLSHFYSLEKAKILDSICLEGISSLNMEKFNQGCEACGLVGIKALINTSIKNNFKSKLLYYNTSYDKTKDASSVVGYASALIGE